MTANQSANPRDSRPTRFNISLRTLWYFLIATGAVAVVILLNGDVPSVLLLAAILWVAFVIANLISVSVTETSAGEGPRSAGVVFSIRNLIVLTAFIGVAAIICRADSGAGEISRAVIVWAIGAAVWSVLTQRLKPLLVGVGLLVLAFFTAGLFKTPHSSPRLPSCPRNLRQIGLALHAYEQDHGSLPPAYVADANGKPLYSWRVLLLPYLERSDLAKAFHYDEAWDSAHNAAVVQAAIDLFHCPDDPQYVNASKPLAMTSYLAVVGPDTAWPGAKPRKLSEIAHPDETILVVEVENSGVNWAEPRDLYVGQMAPQINPKVGQGLSSAHADCANTVFADGSIHSLPGSIDPNILANLFDIGEKAPADRSAF